MNMHKFERDYSDADRALFAEYREARAALTPKECTAGDDCWVRLGPPCYRPHHGSLGDCSGCGGRVKTR